jgi:hypothetical protein
MGTEMIENCEGCELSLSLDVEGLLQICEYTKDVVMQQRRLRGIEPHRQAIPTAKMERKMRTRMKQDEVVLDLES